MVHALLRSIGHPEHGIPAIHVAGTKGKGSVCALSAAVLQAQGYRTGLFTNPSIHTWRERMMVDGRPIGDAAAKRLTELLDPPLTALCMRSEVAEVTGFELSVAMALLHFRQEGVDFNVIEAGMGGASDGTNALQPAVGVITTVGLDHLGQLGNSLEEIAREKAGIIKPLTAIVVAAQEPPVQRIVRRAAQKARAPLVECGTGVRWRAAELCRPPGSRCARGQTVTVAGQFGEYNLYLPLLGEFQLENAAVAVGALESLRAQGHWISPEAMRQGMAGVRWPCRLEVLDAGRAGPLVVADVAHNPLAAARLRQALPRCFDYDRLVLIMDVSRRHDVRGIVAELAPLRPEVVLLPSRGGDGSVPEPLHSCWNALGIAPHEAVGAAEALSLASSLAGRRGLVLATGTFPIAAMIREEVKGITPELSLTF